MVVVITTVAVCDGQRCQMFAIGSRSTENVRYQQSKYRKCSPSAVEVLSRTEYRYHIFLRSYCFQQYFEITVKILIYSSITSHPVKETMAYASHGKTHNPTSTCIRLHQTATYFIFFDQSAITCCQAAVRLCSFSQVTFFRVPFSSDLKLPFSCLTPTVS